MRSDHRVQSHIHLDLCVRRQSKRARFRAASITPLRTRTARSLAEETIVLASYCCDRWPLSHPFCVSFLVQHCLKCRSAGFLATCCQSFEWERSKAGCAHVIRQEAVAPMDSAQRAGDAVLTASAAAEVAAARGLALPQELLHCLAGALLGVLDFSGVLQRVRLPQLADSRVCTP